MTASLLLCALVSVTDGDTFRAYCPRDTIIRIANIDAPETTLCPLESAKATEVLTAALQGPISVQPLYYDKYGRVVAVVTVDGVGVGDKLLSLGVVNPWPFDKQGNPLADKPKGC